MKTKEEIAHHEFSMVSIKCYGELSQNPSSGSKVMERTQFVTAKNNIMKVLLLKRDENQGRNSSS